MCVEPSIRYATYETRFVNILYGSFVSKTADSCTARAASACVNGDVVHDLTTRDWSPFSFYA
jgi:hypothetical protein